MIYMNKEEYVCMECNKKVNEEGIIKMVILECIVTDRTYYLPLCPDCRIKIFGIDPTIENDKNGYA